jgi:hypothetical protein
LLSILGVIAILTVCCFVFRELWLSIVSTFWPSTQGLIIKSDVAERRDTEGTSFEVTLEYSFRVGNSPLIGDTIAYGWSGRFNSQEEAEKEIDKYPVSSKVTVYYHPFDLDKSVLLPGLGKLQAGCIFFLFLVIYFFV